MIFFYNGWEQSTNDPHADCIRQLRRSNRTNESETSDNPEGLLVENDRKGILDMEKLKLELKLLTVRDFGLLFGCFQLAVVGLVMEK